MAFVAARLPSEFLTRFSATAGTQLLDATNDAAGIIFACPIAGDITKIHYYCTALVGTPIIRASLQGVVAGRTIDATILAGGLATGEGTPTLNVWNTVTLGTPATVTQGQMVAAVIQYISGATSATVQSHLTPTGAADNSPYSFTISAAVYAYGSNIPSVTIEYSDGTTFVGFPARPLTLATFNSGTNPLLIGMKWTPLVTCKVDGIMMSWIRVADTFDFVVEVYTAGSGTPTYTSPTFEGDRLTNTAGGASSNFIQFPALTLTAGIAYRFVIRPTTITNPTAAAAATFMNAASFASAVGGSEWAYTANNAQDDSWTDTANQFVGMVPRITEIDIPAGGGGGMRLAGRGGLAA